jgi:hypothetical protein
MITGKRLSSDNRNSVCSLMINWQNVNDFEEIPTTPLSATEDIKRAAFKSNRI